MQTSINLQEPFTYSIIPLLFSICVVIAMTWYLMYTKNTNKRRKE